MFDQNADLRSKPELIFLDLWYARIIERSLAKDVIFSGVSWVCLKIWRDYVKQ